jgi:RNA polymerase sigma-70 factor (ECF subfamily)
LWREFDKFEPGSDFLAWARTVARYVALTHFNERGRKPRLLDSDVAEAIMAKVAKPAAETDRRLEILSGCVKKLGGNALDLLRRCYVDRQKIKEIAAELNRSLTGTYSAISRVRRELLECVREGMNREDGP